MYGSKTKEILEERHMSHSSKMLRKKYPRFSLSPKASALDKMKEGKGGSQKKLDRVNEERYEKKLKNK